MSARLHLWIDLIFGYRQQGPTAVEAVNTFHPYFHTDKYNTASMKDPVMKSTILGYINNFGQMPKQVRVLSCGELVLSIEASKVFSHLYFLAIECTSNFFFPSVFLYRF